MKNRLIELNGIDNIKEFSFNCILDTNVEGDLEFIDKKLTGATINKELINYKVINSFEDINNDLLEIFNNILILSIKFNINIEYCESANLGKLNLLNFVFYKTFFTSLKNYDFSNIEPFLLIDDFYLIENEHRLNYHINIVVGLNET